MAAPSSKKRFSRKDKKPDRYILTLLNEKTLERTFHMRLSRAGVIIVTGVSVLILLVLFSLLIVFTPLRKLLPANTEEFRDELMIQTMRVDSLQTVIDVQTAYLSTMRDVLAGQVPTDSILPLDSLQMVAQEALLEARSQITSDFMAEYEAMDDIMKIGEADTIEWK